METKTKCFIVILFLLLFNNQYVHSKNQIVRCWSNNQFGYMDSVACDTSWENFQIMNPIYKNSISNSHLGALGSAYINNDFANRSNEEFIFYNPYLVYMQRPLTVTYYNTRKPLTNVTYSASQGSKSSLEQTFRIIHTQNINPDFNAGFMYDVINNNGYFRSGDSWINPLKSYKRGKKNSFTFFSCYNLDYYDAHMNVIFNKIGPLENIGGVYDDTFITDTNVRNNDVTTILNNKAGSVIRNKNIHFNHEFKFGSYTSSDTNQVSKNAIFALGHTLDFEQAYRKYFDFGISSDTSFYFDHGFRYDSLNTKDSCFYRSFKNSLYFKVLENPFAKFTLTGVVGIEFDFKKMGFLIDSVIPGVENFDTVSLYHSSIVFNNTDSTYINIYSEKIFESSLNANLHTILRDNFYLNVIGKYYLSGYYLNNYNLDLILSKYIKLLNERNELKISINTNQHTPNYFVNNYSSNYYNWNESINNFADVISNQIKFELYNDTNKYHFSYQVNRVNNYTYYGLNSVPEQYKDAIYINSVNVFFKFNLWKFYFKNKILYQETNANDTVLSLPDFSVYNSTYFQFDVVKNVLKMQVGFDLYYNTKFYYPAYNPSIGQFHTQNIKTIGDYPVFNVFVNAKWKQVRIYAILEHANYRLNENKLSYFSALHYPLNPRFLKLGLSWNFYN